jgi:cholesterol transport system auxiliary component
MRSILRAASLPLLALLAAGCFGGGAAPAELLTLTPAQTLPPGEARSAGSDGALAVLAPSCPALDQHPPHPVYVDAITIEYLKNATYVEEPHQLFRRVLAETIGARTGRLVLDPGNFTQEAGATLSGQLLQFGFEPARMQVVVSYEAAIAPLDRRAPDPPLRGACAGDRADRRRHRARAQPGRERRRRPGGGLDRPLSGAGPCNPRAARTLSDQAKDQAGE